MFFKARRSGNPLRPDKVKPLSWSIFVNDFQSFWTGARSSVKGERVSSGAFSQMSWIRVLCPGIVASPWFMIWEVFPPPSNNGCQVTPGRFAIWWLLYREFQVWASLSPGTQVLSVFTKFCSRASGTLGAFGSVCGVDGVMKNQGQCTET